MQRVVFLLAHILFASCVPQLNLGHSQGAAHIPQPLATSDSNAQQSVEEAKLSTQTPNTAQAETVHVDVPANTAQAPPAEADRVDVPANTAQAPPEAVHVDVPPKTAQAPPAETVHVDVPPNTAEAEAVHVDVPPNTAEAEAVHVDVPSQQSNDGTVVVEADENKEHVQAPPQSLVTSQEAQALVPEMSQETQAQEAHSQAPEAPQRQAPETAPLADSASLEADAALQAEVDAQMLPTAEEQADPQIKALARAPPLFAMQNAFPAIDFVFTWYNGNDQGTQRLRQKTLSPIRRDPHLSPDSLFPGRYNDNDELRYSLRSVEKYASWSRKVFLVIGDGQPLPKWLNKSASKLRIVRHSEFFPPDAKLPTFNSLSIESCFHRIKGLSDYFVYFNDDTFLGNWVSPNTFFSEWGRPRVWLSDYTDKSPLSRKDGGHAAAEKNTHRLLRFLTKSGAREVSAYDRHLQHQCKALSKAMLGRAEDMVPNQFLRLRQAQFRKLNTISAITFASHMCVHRGDCENAQIPSYVFANVDQEGVANVLQRIRREQPALICLNNGMAEVKDEMIAAMRSLYPNRSQFEK